MGCVLVLSVGWSIFSSPSTITEAASSLCATLPIVPQIYADFMASSASSGSVNGDEGVTPVTVDEDLAQAIKSSLVS